MSPALLSAIILVVTLAMFASERVRPDMVALFALFAAVIAGLVTPSRAFEGFADPAVIAVAAILVVGRAVELSGLASRIARVAVPPRLPFSLRITALLIVSAFLSAFMNNIAALVIAMPIATEVAREARKPPAATLMPLAFATILGGMTTLIGTPANLILSSVRQEALGEPFRFFTMTPVGVGVTVIGLAYLAMIGWRLLPIRRAAEREARPPWRVYELRVPLAAEGETLASFAPRLRKLEARALALFRKGARVETETLQAGDRVLTLARQNQWLVAERAGLVANTDIASGDDTVTARVVVAHGSFLVGQSHAEIYVRSRGLVAVVAAGPAAARARQPLGELLIREGDQLFVRGTPANLAAFIAQARLLEIDRLDPAPLAPRQALMTVGIFAAAIVAIVAGIASPALAFVAAAVVIAAARLIPPAETYRSIDWPVIVLLGAMIPVGESFQTSGAAAAVAEWLGTMLATSPPFVVCGTLCLITLLLSIFLNNVATAVIMGPLAIDVAAILGLPPDAALIAVLIGASSDFLTPIGHQNNLLVMGPGAYRFTDYARMGAPLVVCVIVTTAALLSLFYV